MTRRGERRRIAPGIYQDQYGLAATVKVGTHPNALTREQRYPKGTPLKTIKAWQDETRVQLRKQLAPGAGRGTFAADVRRYYDTGSFKDLVHQEDRRRDLDAWLPLFGHRRRATIRPDEINAQLQAWRASGLSASTCSHRLDAITQLYTVLDGAAAANPGRGGVRFRKPDPVARALTLDVIDRVIADIPTTTTKARRGKTIARLQMMRWTGARPAQLRRLPLDAFDLTSALPSVLIPRAKGGKVARVPLVIPEGVDAARAFIATGCTATRKADGRVTPSNWSCGSTNMTIARACRRLDIAPFNLYRLRHTVAQTLRAAGVPLDDIADTLGHTDTLTTRVYAAPVTAVQMAQFQALRVAPRMAPEDGTRNQPSGAGVKVSA